MFGFVALLALLGSTVPALTASAATRVPAVAAQPSSPARPGATIGVSLTTLGDRISCASPTACLAVGANYDSSGNPSTPLAIALHGTAWKSVPVKAPAGATATALTGVSCKAATYCLVVGEYGDKNGNAHPAAWTWNGTALTPVAAPSLPGGTSLDVLTAVSCVAVKSCVAVGSAYGAANTVRLAWTWNGTSWTRKTATPGSGQSETQLTAVHCFSLTSCVAAGSTDTFSGQSLTGGLLLATWNGKAFTAQKAGAMSLSFGIVSAVSCFSPSHCAVVGANVNLKGNNTTMTGFAQVWNGKTWTASSWTGPKGSTESALLGVSCTTAASCLATGLTGTQKAGSAAALSFNGTAWSAVKVPSVGAGLVSDFEDVSCPKTGACVAIGEYGKSTQANGKPLAGYWNGSAWKLKAA